MEKSYFVLITVLISMAICEAHVCTQRAAPINGRMLCLNRTINGIGRKRICRFICQSGYHLQGYRQVSCNYLGSWNRPFPVCLNDSQCWRQPPSPTNGKVECTNGYKKGSQCRFQCNRGYKMKGYSFSRCQDNGYWSNERPICQPIQKFCGKLPAQPEYGYRSCTYGRRLGSFCYFQCASGFVQIGSSISVCSVTKLGPKWSSPPPKCNEKIPTACSSLPPTPRNGEVSCLNGRQVGSVCHFECNKEYTLIGARTTTCYYNKQGRVAHWNMMTPVCHKVKPFSCDSLPLKPRDGELSCTDTNTVGSTCYFECHEGFVVVGRDATTCYYDRTEQAAVWSDISPICQRILQDDVGVNLCPEIESIENGDLSCPNANEINAECTFTCNRGYQLYPSDHNTARCTYEGSWNVTKPCCAIKRNCDESHKADVVIMMDSSTSFGEKNWKLVKNFVHNFIDSFSDTLEKTRCSVFRFSNFVDKDSQILLKDWVDNKKSLLRKFDEIPKNLTIGSSLEGALRHLFEEILNEANGDRPEVKNTVLLFTNSIPKNDLSATTKQLLKSRSTKIYIIRINMGLLNEPAEIHELAKITGCYGHIIQPEYDLSGVTRTLSRIKLCRSACGYQSSTYDQDHANDIRCYPIDHHTEV